MVNALTSADKAFAKTGINSLVGASIVKKRTISIKNGAPGGWPTSNLYPLAINSPQSQKLAVGSMVAKYTNEAIAKIIQPPILLYFRKELKSILSIKSRFDSTPKV